MSVVAMGLMTGCGGSKSAELKGYAEGCQMMAHNILDPAGYRIDDAKLAEFCKKAAEEALKQKK